MDNAQHAPPLRAGSADRGVTAEAAPLGGMRAEAEPPKVQTPVAVPGPGKDQGQGKGQGKTAGQGKGKGRRDLPPARPPASPARLQRRHVVLAASFLALVLAPLLAAAIYLYAVASDQYASHVGFSVRTEEAKSAIELLGGITELSGSSSSDTDILYEFIQSQQMVRAVQERLDLTAIYDNPDDPVFGLGEDIRIEALSDYWSRMVKVFYDRASGLIEVRVLAFQPEPAHAIATAVFDISSAMINDLSAIARADATRYAEEELTRSVERLKDARKAITAFRARNQLVDPLADIQGQMGILNSLQAQMAEAQIELELLLDNSSESDPRVQQARRKIAAIQQLIDEEEQRNFGTGTGDQDISRLLEEFEALQVEREFAEKSYLSAQATYDSALAEAQRKSRYLASHIAPTMAETPEYPRRVMLLAIIGGFAFLFWSILVMIYYSLRDRR